MEHICKQDNLTTGHKSLIQLPFLRMWSRFAKKIFFSLKHTSPELCRMWSRGAEMTRDLWLANGRKDAATYQLTRVGVPISIELHWSSKLEYEGMGGEGL